ncbi:MAG: anthranilate synthase component I family protein [Spirochaetota bacterium]
MRVFERWGCRRAGLDPLALLDRAGREPFALLYGSGERGRYMIHAHEPLGRLSRPAPGDFEFSREGEPPPFFPDFIGIVSYEWGAALAPLVPPALDSPLPLPAFSFVLYRRVSIHDRSTGLLYEGLRSIEGGAGEGFAPEEGGKSVLGEGGFATRFLQGTENAASYAAKVAQVRDAIAAGDVYQANLTRQEEWEYRGDLRSFAKALYRENPAPFSAFIAEPAFAIASASPERLVNLAEGRLESRPIKGTAPRGADEAEDRRLALALLASEKDRAELAMIVDLVRNDLARTCLRASTRVLAFPVLETYANVHHLVATVEGRFDRSKGLGGLLTALLPGGSITGCPKIAAMRIIRSLEPWPRAIYTGSIGWFSFDLSALDLNIAIRTVWADATRLRFGVGGAVVWDSDPAAEYIETVHKARSILSCLNSATGRW